MITVWKYPMPIAETFSLDLPLYMEIVSVAWQPNVGAFLWAKVDTLSPILPRSFRITRTGEEAPRGCWHIKSFHAESYALHLWGMLESSEQLNHKARLETLPRHLRRPVSAGAIA